MMEGCIYCGVTVEEFSSGDVGQYRKMEWATSEGGNGRTEAGMDKFWETHPGMEAGTEKFWKMNPGLLDSWAPELFHSCFHSGIRLPELFHFWIRLRELFHSCFLPGFVLTEPFHSGFCSAVGPLRGFWFFFMFFLLLF